MIETTRLYLRPPKIEEVQILSQLWQLESVQQYTGGVLSPEEAEDRVYKILKTWETENQGLWAVFEKENLNLIGLCGFGNFEGEVEIIYRFFPEYWGKGYATEAAFSVLQYGFEALHLKSIIGITQASNTASHRVLEKLGMSHLHNFIKWHAEQRYYKLTKENFLKNIKALHDGYDKEQNWNSE